MNDCLTTPRLWLRRCVHASSVKFTLRFEWAKMPSASDDFRWWWEKRMVVRTVNDFKKKDNWNVDPSSWYASMFDLNGSFRTDFKTPQKKMLWQQSRLGWWVGFWDCSSVQQTSTPFRLDAALIKNSQHRFYKRSVHTFQEINHQRAQRDVVQYLYPITKGSGGMSDEIRGWILKGDRPWLRLRVSNFEIYQHPTHPAVERMSEEGSEE